MMKIKNYIKRKYPISYQEILNEFNENELIDLKRYKRRIGRLNKDLIYVGRYRKGQLCIWNRYKTIDEDDKWMGVFDIYCVVKCEKGLTESGYHSINVHESDIDEILN